ncbi:MAG TPA: hypothetical protein GXZ45_08150 [Propionibacterium sp.]|nr:hypothetical protein [Propionibacterium sp.]
MSRAFWFFAGAAASAYVAVKGREYYRRLTPEGMADEIERRTRETGEAAKSWLDDFATTYSNARAAKRSELMALLTKDERGQLE